MKSVSCYSLAGEGGGGKWGGIVAKDWCIIA